MNAPVLYSGEMVPFADLDRMAEAFAKAKLFGAKTKEEVLSLMLVAQAEGMHPASAARDYDIIQGKGSKKSEAMMRDFLRAGGKVEWHKLDDACADATFSHHQGGTVRISWDMKRAEAAGLKEKEMYRKYPRQMLRARTISEGVRTVCPLATGGMYTPEEAADMDAIPGEVISKTTVVEGPRSKSEPATPPASEPASNANAESQPAGGAGQDDKPLTPGAIKTLQGAMARAGRTEADLAVAGFPEIGKMRFEQHFNKAMTWLKEHPAI